MKENASKDKNKLSDDKVAHLPKNLISVTYGFPCTAYNLLIINILT